MRKRIKKKKQKYWKDIIKSLKSPEKMDDELFKYLVKAKIELVELGHVNFSDSRLQMLAPYVEEARMTLLERAYGDNQYSPEKFKEYLFAYAAQISDESNLLLLLESERKNIEKAEILLEYCKKFKTKMIQEIARSIEIANQVEKSRDVHFIEQMYKFHFDNSYILLEIAKNPITPESIRDELKNIKGIKFAKQIRSIANEILKGKW